MLRGVSLDNSNIAGFLLNADRELDKCKSPLGCHDRRAFLSVLQLDEVPIFPRLEEKEYKL